MHIDDLIKKLNSISCIYHDQLKELEKKYPHIGKNDIRFTFFHKCISVFDNILILKITRKYYITDEEFFKKHSDKITIREGLDEQFIAEHGNEYNNLWKDENEKKYGYFYNLLTNEIDSFAATTFFHGMFQAFESTLRPLYPLIKGKDIPEVFYQVSTGLESVLGLTKYSNFFQIIRNLRNSIHNNGIHTKNDLELEWNGFKYKFVKDKPIELENLWDRWFNIANTLKDILETIFTKTTNIPTIPDQMVIQKSI